MSLAVFLPTRKGSERVSNKNTRPFAGDTNGLLGHKLEQLRQLKGFTTYLSTNDEECIRIANDFEAAGMDLRVVVRPEHLCTSQTRLKDLIAYVPSIIDAEHILWTHVTSPFVDAEIYLNAIKQYFDDTVCDSMMSVTKIQEFLWSDAKREFVNFKRTFGEWPRTQDIEPVYSVNSGFFIAPRSIYFQGDRIGSRPCLFELTPKQAIDVDWEEDFKFAELIYQGDNR